LGLQRLIKPNHPLRWQSIPGGSTRQPGEGRGVGDTIKNIMTKEMLAAQLNGREIGNETETADEMSAKDNNLVIVYGYSDDNIEFRGAIYDEIGSYGGGDFEFTKSGVFRDEDDDEVLKKYGTIILFNKIKAVWCPKDSQGNVYASWAYETEIPHATFDIMEDGELFSRGIVFSLNDLK
jgi:hypothetical protein